MSSVHFRRASDDALGRHLQSGSVVADPQLAKFQQVLSFRSAIYFQRSQALKVVESHIQCLLLRGGIDGHYSQVPSLFMIESANLDSRSLPASP